MKGSVASCFCQKHNLQLHSQNKGRCDSDETAHFWGKAAEVHGSHGVRQRQRPSDLTVSSGFLFPHGHGCTCHGSRLPPMPWLEEHLTQGLSVASGIWSTHFNTISSWHRNAHIPLLPTRPASSTDQAHETWKHHQAGNYFRRDLAREGDWKRFQKKILNKHRRARRWSNRWWIWSLEPR